MRNDVIVTVKAFAYPRVPLRTARKSMINMASAAFGGNGTEPTSKSILCPPRAPGDVLQADHLKRLRCAKP